MGKFTARVKRGIKFLNEFEPGWLKKINLKYLDMSQPYRFNKKSCGCIGVQLHEHFCGADAKWKYCSPSYDADKYGFDLPYDEGFADNSKDYWKEMTKEWKQQIKELKEKQKA